MRIGELYIDAADFNLKVDKMAKTSMINLTTDEMALLSLTNNVKTDFINQVGFEVSSNGVIYFEDDIYVRMRVRLLAKAITRNDINFIGAMIKQKELSGTTH